MSQSDAGTAKGAGRRAKVFLSPSKKYDIYIQLMRGQTMVGAIAAQAGVDRSTIMRLQQVARQGALEALAASRPGASGRPARDIEPGQARAEIERLTRTVTEQAAGLVVLEKKVDHSRPSPPRRPTSRSVSPLSRPWKPRTCSPPRWNALRLSSAGWF